MADGPPAEIRALAGGRTVSFDLAGGPADGLDALPGVRSVQVRGGRVALTTDDADATVLALAGTRGFQNLEVTTAALDAAFLALTTTAMTRTTTPTTRTAAPTTRTTTPTEH
ncbi:hypothetical protein [Micromonospora sp. CA-246542]|uniref:hypothetical protein n=1 Tax=Micromonospora sp. CA-246542 TaxID=3239959 RepID=UPI003D9362C7